jgi:hypothetical protein
MHGDSNMIREALQTALAQMSPDVSEEAIMLIENVLAQKVNDVEVADKGGTLCDLIDLIVWG